MLLNKQSMSAATVRVERAFETVPFAIVVAVASILVIIATYSLVSMACSKKLHPTKESTGVDNHAASVA